jgi:hypothetical protein
LSKISRSRFFRADEELVVGVDAGVKDDDDDEINIDDDNVREFPASDVPVDEAF